MAGVFSGKQRAARRVPQRGSSIKLREPHTSGRELIEVRGLDELLTVRAKIAPTEIVGDNQNDVRRVGAALFPGFGWG